MIIRLMFLDRRENDGQYGERGSPEYDAFARWFLDPPREIDRAYFEKHWIEIARWDLPLSRIWELGLGDADTMSRVGDLSLCERIFVATNDDSKKRFGGSAFMDPFKPGAYVHYPKNRSHSSTSPGDVVDLGGQLIICTNSGWRRLLAL